MNKPSDWFNAALVIALAVAVIWLAFLLGRMPVQLLAQ